MPGLLSTERLTRARPRWSRSVMTARIRQRRERAVERAFRRMVARGEIPREFAEQCDMPDLRRR